MAAAVWAGLPVRSLKCFSGRKTVAAFVWFVPVKRLNPVMAKVPSTPGVARPIADTRLSTSSVRSIDDASGNSKATTR